MVFLNIKTVKSETRLIMVFVSVSWELLMEWVCLQGFPLCRYKFISSTEKQYLLNGGKIQLKTTDMLDIHEIRGPSQEEISEGGLFDFFNYRHFIKLRKLCLILLLISEVNLWRTCPARRLKIHNSLSKHWCGGWDWN